MLGNALVEAWAMGRLWQKLTTTYGCPVRLWLGGLVCHYLGLFLGVVKVRNWGGFPVNHHTWGDFDSGKIMAPVWVVVFVCLV